MKNLNSKYIIQILETFDTSKYLFIIMDYIRGGDLLSFVRKRTKLDEQTSKFIFKQIIEGLAFIHTNNIVHRDIKLDNILIDIDDNVKVILFFN